ncbi:MAG: hypothetical protein E4G98_07435, partial [Promethearchaeota archaeon]
MRHYLQTDQKRIWGLQGSKILLMLVVMSGIGGVVGDDMGTVSGRVDGLIKGTSETDLPPFEGIALGETFVYQMRNGGFITYLK